MGDSNLPIDSASELSGRSARAAMQQLLRASQPLHPTMRRSWKLCKRSAGSDPTNFQASWLLAQLLDWHRREEKPEWWRFFDRTLRCDEDDLFVDTEAVAGLIHEGEIGRVARSAIHRYRFDPTQDHKLKEGPAWCDPDSERSRQLSAMTVPAPGTVFFVDPVRGLVDLKRGLTRLLPIRRSLVPHPVPISTGPQRGALKRVADSIVASGIDGYGPYRAIRDLLLRHSPRLLGGPSRGPLRLSAEPSDDAVVRIALALDGGTLAVQGPPGSGKTRTAARTIVELIHAGQKVGVTANSHAVITNLLENVVESAENLGTVFRFPRSQMWWRAFPSLGNAAIH